MELPIQEPVSRTIYDLVIEEGEFEPWELKQQLNGIETDLDRICRKLLEEEQYCSIEYNVSVFSGCDDDYIGMPMVGRFELSEREFFVPLFQRQYRESFGKILERNSQHQVSISIKITGFVSREED